MRRRGGVTHHDGQPVIVEGASLKVFAQPHEATGEEKEGQDPCGRAASSWEPALHFPSTLPGAGSSGLVLTDTSYHQQLPEEQQQICDLVQDHHPARGEARAGRNCLYHLQ